MPRSRFLFWGFKSTTELVGSALGRLEREVLDIVWDAGEVSVRDVHDRMKGAIAYTTLMTTLDRLFKKRLLKRRKTGRAFAYSAVATRDDLERTIASDVLSSLLEGSRATSSPALSCLVDAVGDMDERLLRELERLVRNKRRQLQGLEPE